MDEHTFQLIENVLPKSYAMQAVQARKKLSSKINELVSKRRCPDEGWTDSSIELLLEEISLMDSNNFLHNVGVGERESRIYSGLVSRRHFNMGHGIGRSGDLTEIQPKAVGSSLLYKLTNSMALHAIKISGINSVSDCIVVPLATGMSLVLCLLTIKKQRPEAKYVIWARIDQKSCFKSIKAAGFEPIIVENVVEGDELRTDICRIEQIVKARNSQTIAAIMTTTSCFAPRGIDKLEEVAKICADNDIPHVVNNAYGLQSSKCSHHIEQAARIGRVDCFVQSTDKNFMVPVGGAIIAGFDKQFISSISQTYPGRASCSPITDLFITLLSMGVSGYKQLLDDRKRLKEYLHEQMKLTAKDFDLKVLETKNNPISIALTMPSNSSSVTELGSMLFTRGVSGTRVLTSQQTKTIDGYTFKGWGTHTDKSVTPYLTAAASIGMTKREVDVFIMKLSQCLTKFTKEHLNDLKCEDK